MTEACAPQEVELALEALCDSEHFRPNSVVLWFNYRL